jgi:hypothetical protein
MTPVEFETTISAGKRPQTHALERAANGTSLNSFKSLKIVKVEELCYFCGTAHSTGASGRQSEHHTMVSVKQSLDTPACHAVNGVRVQPISTDIYQTCKAMVDGKTLISCLCISPISETH